MHAVELMAATVGERLGVKASGGIRDYATANALVAAGATRLGLSGTRAVLDGADGPDDADDVPPATDPSGHVGMGSAY